METIQSADFLVGAISCEKSGQPGVAVPLKGSAVDWDVIICEVGHAIESSTDFACARFFVLCLTAAPVACASGGSSLDDYAGNWVMKVGQRNFIVISLKNEGGHLTGTASRPKHFQLTDGSSFSEISSGIEVGTIARSSIEQGHLSFVVHHPGDKNADDEDDFEMTLTREQSITQVCWRPD